MNAPRASMVLCLLCIAALGETACRRASPSQTNAVWITLPRSGLRVQTGEPVVISSAIDRTTLTSNPNSRAPIVLEVFDDSNPSGNLDRSLDLGAGATLRYTVQRASGGSGGDEATVRGVVRAGAQSWSVRCHSQSEFGDPEVRCVTLLSTLRVPSGR